MESKPGHYYGNGSNTLNHIHSVCRKVSVGLLEMTIDRNFELLQETHSWMLIRLSIPFPIWHLETPLNPFL